MPAAVPFLVASGIGVGIGVLTVEAFIAGVVIAGLSYAIQTVMAESLLQRAQVEGLRYNVRSNVEPLPIVYGIVGHVSGAVVLQRANSKDPVQYRDNTQHLNTVIVWSEGEIGGLSALYLDDIDATDDKYNGTYQLVWWAHYSGSDTQAADTYLVNKYAADPLHTDRWTSAHRLLGVAYTRVTCSATVAGVFTAIPTFTADLNGIMCTDWRTGTRYTSNNPAVILYDYLTNTRYGCAIPAAEIDLDSFSTAANYCDVYLVPLGFPGARKRYQCSGTLSPDDSRLDNVTRILQTCRGFLIYSGGLYKLLIDKPEVAAFAFTEDNITGEWTIQLDALGQRFNRVTARFINRANASKPDFVVVDSPTYRTTDGGEVLDTDIDLLMVTSGGQAADIAGMALRQSRYSIMVEFTATLAGMGCEVGDVVTLTHSVPGWVAKKFRVISLALKNSDEVSVRLTEYSDDVYDITAANDLEYPPGTTLPNPSIIAAVTNLTAVGGSYLADLGVRRRFMNMTWTLPTVEILAVDVEWSGDGVTWSTATIHRDDAVSYQMEDLLAAVLYTIRVRVRNSINAASPWATVTALAGAPGAPAALSQLTATGIASAIRVAWTVPTDARVTLVRLIQNTAADFDAGAIILGEYPVGPGYVDVPMVTGQTRYYWAKTFAVPGGYSFSYTPPGDGNGVGATAL